MRALPPFLSFSPLLVTACLALGIPSAAAGSDTPQPASADTAAEPSPEQLALGYMTASFILEIATGVANIPNLTLETGIDGKIRRIDQANAAALVAEFQATLQNLHEAIQRTGYGSIAGTYTARATEACERSQSMWAGGISKGLLSDVRIVQDGYKVSLRHEFRHQGSSRGVETPGIVVESVLVFSDLANSDFTFVARVDSGEITARPNVEAILATWPNLVPAPLKRDLAECTVTLRRVGDQAGDSR